MLPLVGPVVPAVGFVGGTVVPAVVPVAPVPVVPVVPAVVPVVPAVGFVGGTVVAAPESKIKYTFNMDTSNGGLFQYYCYMFTRKIQNSIYLHSNRRCETTYYLSSNNLFCSCYFRK